MLPAPLTAEKDAPASWERRLVYGSILITALALPLAWWALRPGYSVYDEEGVLDMQQSWLATGHTFWHMAHGCLHRGMLHLVLEAAGPRLAWLPLLRLPSLLAMLMAGLLLVQALKARLGERAALWAALAWITATSFWSQAGAMLCFTLMPAVFLAHWLALERLDRPWQALLWGLSASAWTLDYEGWYGALLALAVAGLWLHRKRPALWGAGGAGLLLGLGTLAHLSDLPGYLQTRGQIIRAGNDSLARSVLANLKSLLAGGDRLPISDVTGTRWPAPWIWPLLLLGFWPALRAWPLLGWFMAVGSLPLTLSTTHLEPHRLVILQLGLCACAGVGAARLARWRGGLLGVLVLWLLGLGAGAWAFAHADPAGMERAYGVSWDQDAAAQWLQQHAPPEGWRLIDGLGSWDDGAFRLRLAALDVPIDGGRPVAYLHWDYLPATRGMAGSALQFSHAPARGAYLFFPDPRSATRLEAIQAQLIPMHALEGSSFVSQRDLLTRWLRDGNAKDPWARTVLWERWFGFQIQFSVYDGPRMRALLAEPLVDAWLWDALAVQWGPGDPRSLGLLARAQRLDPRRTPATPDLYLHR